jgi:hypothetical protein
MFEKAQEFYKKSIASSKKSKDSISLQVAETALRRISKEKVIKNM